jgi:hypothetical protein
VRSASAALRFCNPAWSWLVFPYRQFPSNRVMPSPLSCLVLHPRNPRGCSWHPPCRGRRQGPRERGAGPKGPCASVGDLVIGCHPKAGLLTETWTSPFLSAATPSLRRGGERESSYPPSDGPSAHNVGGGVNVWIFMEKNRSTLGPSGRRSAYTPSKRLYPSYTQGRQVPHPHLPPRSGMPQRMCMSYVISPTCCIPCENSCNLLLLL